MISKVAAAYGVNAMAGTLMHQVKRYVLDGTKTINLREDTSEKRADGSEATIKTPDCTFELYEVYAVDVCMSTGDGKPRENGDFKTSVFKR